jgi:hypothetical protein
MASQKFSQLDQFADAANDLTNKIATKVQTLLDDLKGGVSAQEADALIQKNQGIVDALNAIAANGEPVVDPTAVA